MDVYIKHGSSPRVRGILRYVGNDKPLRRFIPACTGNTNHWPRCKQSLAVHPRVYGEYGILDRLYLLITGSSPRVRGILRPRHVRGPRRRFIPACTGNTKSTEKCAVISPVHPRVYGEYVFGYGHTRTNSGSSPRVRGIPDIHALEDTETRFIPACTGNTRSGCSFFPVHPVHPRVYGEYFLASVGLGSAIGSSPRVRGIRRPEPRYGPVVRFIPACTGNTAALSFRP